MPLKLKKKKRCKCPLCKRHDRLVAIRKKLSPADADYLEMFEDYVLECEANESMQDALKEQRN